MALQRKILHKVIAKHMYWCLQSKTLFSKDVSQTPKLVCRIQNTSKVSNEILFVITQRSVSQTPKNVLNKN